MNAISINHVSKTYKNKKALDDLSLDVKNGEFLGLLGVNGAGKTTLIKILCGLTRKSDGTVFIHDLDLDKDLDEIKKIVDVSPQETSVALNLTVKENLDFFANLYGNNTPDFLDGIIKTFHLQNVLRQRAKTLSGGYKRRLSIAVALISKPKILFLDEPTLGLDIFARKELWDILEGLKGHTTIILTSHYLDEIQRLCDRVAILSKGKLLQIGTIDEIAKNTDSATLEEAFLKLGARDYE